MIFIVSVYGHEMVKKNRKHQKQYGIKVLEARQGERDLGLGGVPIDVLSGTMGGRVARQERKCGFHDNACHRASSRHCRQLCARD